MAPLQLEDVLSDLAAQARSSAYGAQGARNLLGPAQEKELAALTTRNTPSNRPPVRSQNVVVDCGGPKTASPVAAREIPRPTRLRDASGGRSRVGARQRTRGEGRAGGNGHTDVPSEAKTDAPVALGASIGRFKLASVPLAVAPSKISPVLESGPSKESGPPKASFLLESDPPRRAAGLIGARRKGRADGASHRRRTRR